MHFCSEIYTQWHCLNLLFFVTFYRKKTLIIRSIDAFLKNLKSVGKYHHFPSNSEAQCRQGNLPQNTALHSKNPNLSPIRVEFIGILPQLRIPHHFSDRNGHHSALGKEVRPQLDISVRAAIRPQGWRIETECFVETVIQV